MKKGKKYDEESPFELRIGRKTERREKTEAQDEGI